MWGLVPSLFHLFRLVPIFKLVLCPRGKIGEAVDNFGKLLILLEKVVVVVVDNYIDRWSCSICSKFLKIGVRFPNFIFEVYTLRDLHFSSGF